MIRFGVISRIVILLHKLHYHLNINDSQIIFNVTNHKYIYSNNVNEWLLMICIISKDIGFIGQKRISN